MSRRNDEWTLLWLQATTGLRAHRAEWIDAWEPGNILRIIRDIKDVRAHRYRQALLGGVPPIPENVLLLSDPQMPDRVRQLEVPPWGFWYSGNIELLSAQARVGIVGSRRPRGNTRHIAKAIAARVAREGIPIVSGLAIGVDGAAHEGAMDAGGHTIAVLGSGLQAVHPSSHRGMAHRMACGAGLVISEYRPDAPGFRLQFKERNRLIAALSDFLVVVQAKHNSGSMQTVDFALGLGVEVGAVPSFIGDINFEAATSLLRSGARAIVSGECVLRGLGREPSISADLHVFGNLLDVPRTPDELSDMSGMPMDDVLDALLDLECDGLVAPTDDGRFANVVLSELDERMAKSQLQ